MATRQIQQLSDGQTADNGDYLLISQNVSGTRRARRKALSTLRAEAFKADQLPANPTELLTGETVADQLGELVPLASPTVAVPDEDVELFGRDAAGASFRALLSSFKRKWLGGVSGEVARPLGDKLTDIFHGADFTAGADTLVVGTLRARGGGKPDQIAICSGRTARHDGGGGIFLWDAGSAANDNGATIIQSSGVVTGRWRRLYSGDVDVRWFGARFDVVQLDGAGAITAGSTSLTVAGASFTSADVGKKIVIVGAGAAGADLLTTIAGRTSATVVTLAAQAGTTVAAAEVAYGTDDTTAILAALTFARVEGQTTGNLSFGGTVLLPSGEAFLSAKLAVGNRVKLRGRGKRVTTLRILPSFADSYAAALSDGNSLNVFECRIQELTIDLAAQAGVGGVQSSYANESSGLVEVHVRRLRNAIGVDVVHPAIDSQGAQNGVYMGCEVAFATTAGSTTIGWRLNMNFSPMRFFVDNTVFGVAGAPTGVGVQIDRINGSEIVNCHLERLTDGILVGSVGSCTGLTFSGIKGGPEMTNLIRVSNATASSHLTFMGLDAATGNCVVLESRPLTLTGQLGFLTVGASGAAGIMFTNKAGVENLFGDINTSRVRIGGFTVLNGRKINWSVPTGTFERSTFATYDAPPISASPTQAEVQAIANHLQIVSRRLAALLNDFHANGNVSGANTGMGLIGVS